VELPCLYIYLDYSSLFLRNKSVSPLNEGAAVMRCIMRCAFKGWRHACMQCSMCVCGCGQSNAGRMQVVLARVGLKRQKVAELIQRLLMARRRNRNRTPCKEGTVECALPEDQPLTWLWPSSIEEVVLRKENLNAHDSSYCCIKTIVDHCRSKPRLKMCHPG
jgi:hypothetical protein